MLYSDCGYTGDSPQPVSMAVMAQRNMKVKYKPRTVVKLIKLWPHARNQGKEIGQIYRIGYYCKDCGIDTVWLVDENGGYNWTADNEFIDRYFEVVESSKERSVYGKGKSAIAPLQYSI
jgi:hypothetical protein